MPYEFNMAGDELADIAGTTHAMNARRDLARVSTRPGAPKAPPNGAPKQPTAGRASRAIYRVHPIPVRGGIPMKGPTRTNITDGKSVTISPDSLGRHLTSAPAREQTEFAGFAGYSGGGFMPGFGNLERHPVPFEHVPQFAGLDGDGMLPDMGGLAGLGKRIPHTAGVPMGTPRTRNLDPAMSKRIAFQKTVMLRGAANRPLPAAAGKMLPGLSAELDTEVVADAQMSADDLYNENELAGPSDGMLPGLGEFSLPIIGEVTIPKVIVAVALLAFLNMARKRYA